MFENIAHRGDMGTVILDDQSTDTDRLLAVGKSVKRVYDIFGMHASGKANLNLDFLTRIIANPRDFEFVFPGCTFNRGDKGIRRRAKRQLAHDNAFGVFGIELGTHEHFAIAIGVFGHIDKTARRKIGKDLKLLSLEIGNLRLQQFDQIVGQNPRGHTRRNTLSALREKHGNFRRKNNGFVIASIVGFDVFGNLRIKEHILRQRGQSAFDITRSRGFVARINIAKIALLIDEQIFVRQMNQRAVNRLIAMGVIFHRLPHDIGDLVKFPIVLLFQRV